MMRDVLIFGLGDVAQLAHFYFSNDSARKVAAFCLDEEYIKDSEYCGLPMVPFSAVAEKYPPSGYDMFIALGYSRLNQLRKEKYDAAKSLGYNFASYVSSRASVYTEQIGDNCFILEDNTLQPFSRVGNNVVMWSGNHIGHHSEIGDHCFLASHIVVSGQVRVGPSCFIGVNATLRDHIKVGDRCIVGAGALLLSDAEPEGVYLGAATERSRVPSSRLRRI